MPNRHRCVSGIARLAVLLTIALIVPTASAAQKRHHKVVCHRNAHHRLTCHAQSRAVKRTATKGKTTTKQPPAASPNQGTQINAGLTGPAFAGSVGSSPAAPAASAAPSTAAQPAPVRFFSPTSIWNTVVSGNVKMDPGSTAIVGNLLQQEASEGLGIATTTFGVPIYVVGPNQPMVHVTLDQGPTQIDLQNAFNAVPIPAGAAAAAGTDANLAVYQPSTDTMWEFWRLSRQTNGWHACWGGEVYHVSTNPGYYQNLFSASGNVLERPWWGAPATSLALVGGVMTISELESGQINHALALGISNTCAAVWAAPAQRTDGVTTGDPTCVPEGAHFRLSPSLNLASLKLPKFTLMLAKAAQKYGIVINNRSDGFTFRAEDPGQFVAQYGYNPFAGKQNKYGSPGALFDEWPCQLLQAFPWSHLQLMKMTLVTQQDMTPITAGS